MLLLDCLERCKVSNTTVAVTGLQEFKMIVTIRFFFNFAKLLIPFHFSFSQGACKAIIK